MRNHEYLIFCNMSKDNITESVLADFLLLAENNPRVEQIALTEESNLFHVISDELVGYFSMGAIAKSLYESCRDSAIRVAKEKEYPVTIRHLTTFKPLGRRFSNKTKKALVALGDSLEPSTAKAQCYAIANYEFEENETVSERFLRELPGGNSAKRLSQLLVQAGRANNVNYTITFEDGSTL